MSTPITVDIPHKLGVAGARERLDRNLGKLESFMLLKACASSISRCISPGPISV